MEPRGLRLMCGARAPRRRVEQGCGDAWPGTSARAHEVLVVSCTGGERGDVLNPRLQDDPHILRDMAQVRRDEMAAAQAILGFEHTWLGFVDSGLPEGDPLPPLPEGCFAARADRGHHRGAGPGDPRVPPARDDDLRRDRRLPAPRPRHVPRRVDVRLRRGRRPRRRTPTPAEPWQPLKLYYIQTMTRARIQRLYDAHGRNASRDRLRRLARGLEAPGPRASRPGSSAPTTSRCATARCSPTPPRSTRTAPGSTTRARSSGRAGRPRTTSAGLVCAGASSEDDLFAGLGSVREADALAAKAGLVPVRDVRPDPQGARDKLASTSGSAG